MQSFILCCRVTAVIAGLEIFKPVYHIIWRWKILTSTLDLKKLEEKARKAGDALREVLVPGFDVNVVDAGLVSKVTVGRDGETIAVYVDFSGTDPSCSFCRMINVVLWKEIIHRIGRRLRKEGFKEIYFLDIRTKSVIEKL